MAGRRGARLFREAIDAHPTPTLLLSRRGTLLHLNAAAEELLSLSAGRWAMKPAAELPRVGPALAALAERARRERVETLGEIDLGPPKGRVGATVAPLPRGGALVVRLREQQGRIDLETLAAGLAHEIRNPLAGLKGAAELMRDELPADAPLRAYTELIAREAARVDGLVRSLLDLTRPPALTLLPANLHALCDDVLLLSRAFVPAGVEVVRRYDPSLPEVELDRDAVAQVLLNLVKNAAEAMAGRQGRIVVETGVAPGMRVRVRDSVRQVVRVAVLDEGPGLPEGVELFTPFATDKPKGTGLGLVLSRRIAEAHGGRLELRDRRDGGGAEAELLLPL